MSKKKKRYYAFIFMIAAEAVAILLTCTGFILRRTAAKGMTQYEDVSDTALPLVMLKDREASEMPKEKEESSEKKEEDGAKSETTTEAPGQTTTEAETDTTDEETGTTDEEETGADEAEESTTEESVKEVDETYFDETLFIGDAKVEGLATYARLGQADYFCGGNFSIFNIFSKKVTNDDFRNATLDQVLASKNYNQIYIILGYNEAVYPYSSLMKQYTYVLERIMELQPQARVILSAVMHVTEEVAKSHEEYSLANLNTISAGIKELSEKYDGVYFIDCNDVFCDADGYLRSGVSEDGEQLTAASTKEWAQEILKRAIVE